MSATPVSETERNRAVWSAGDWDSMSRHIAGVGPRLLDGLGDLAGRRLLDVGTGSGGTVAVPAAQRGALVTGADLTDAWFAAAAGHAADAGVEVEWVVGDAEALPFAEDAFDVVTSTFAHMFAPDHEAAARELVRVCRPGGAIGLCCWTPEGNVGGTFGALAPHLPVPPAGAQPPVRWGDEAHVRALLEPLGVALGVERAAVRFRFASAQAQLDEYEAAFGPVVSARAALGERWTSAREDLLAFLTAVNEPDGGGVGADYEYLQIIGRLDG